MTLPIPVTFLPSETTAWVEPGMTLLEAGRAGGVMIAAPCGGRGICGSCGVRVIEGELCPPDAEEMRGLARAPKSVRLACRAKVCGPVTVRPVISSTKPHVEGDGLRDEDHIVIAVDLGTTNIACLAVELDGGREVASATVPNAQRSWGADVLSRISAALAGDAEALRRAAETSISEAVSAAAGSAHVERVVLAGNTAMVSLLAGVDTSTLATYPFSLPDLPAFLPGIGGKDAPLRETRIDLVPPIVSFVGGDALAGAVHTGLLYAEKPSLLVDLGTNAEIVLAHKGRLFAASAAAGPAFEASGIECGGPAVTGAVAAVSESEDGGLALQTIHGAEPSWMTGAGLVSLLALLRRKGHLSADGAFVLSGPFEDRFSVGEDGVLRFELADGVALTQLDVRSLQLAKAAVRVGIDEVVAAAGVKVRKLEHVYVAGAFGGALYPDDLAELGVVPVEMAPALVSVGNSSLMGAAALALAPDVLESLRNEERDVVHVDLAAKKGFSEALMKALELERR